MAFSSTRSYWRTMLSRLRGSATFATSTSPKTKAYVPTADFGVVQHGKPRPVKGEFVPVYVAVGMILLSMTLGMHTAKQQLMYSPTVHVRKSRRETLPEVEDPDHVVEEAEKFIKKSFFRKVAHVQEFDHDLAVPDPIRGDALARQPHAETLKSVGVDPKAH